MKLYAFVTPGIPENEGYLKIGETNNNVDKRIKEQGHTLNTKIVKVWQDAILTDRSHIDKRIHQYLRDKGFHNQIFQDTGEYTELIKCDVDDLKKAFEVVKQQIYNEEKQRQELCDKFYFEIRNWFYWTAKTGDDPYSVAEPEYTLRLIIRLLLCFFLQEKGLVPKELFDENFIKENLKEDEEYRYYNAILRNLFFNCLNTPIKERTKYEHEKLIKNIRNIKDQFNKVPFLNGGLFYEIEGDEFPLNHEHFFSEPTTRHILELDGDYKVAGIIRILSQYKYKLAVDDLIDSEYAQTVDLEFIGKVFESLLACIDADSKENRRKTTGSFYTPHEIVDYMVNEALDSYLQNYSQKDAQKNSQNDSKDNLQNDSKKDLQNDSPNDSPNDSVLLQCKILDPACGSGAFPCGVMNEIMRRLDPDKKLTQQERYYKKVEILQKVIYGVDIQPIAVQITILRLFLSLIQEIVPDRKKDNFGIEPLPNLETKFICANTLIGSTNEKGKLQLQRVKTTVKQLQLTREQHIVAKTPQQKKILQDYDKELRILLSEAMEDVGELSHETAELLLKWNPYDQTKSTPFFDPQWMFGIDDGFDIVIGNPPYISIERLTIEQRELYKKTFRFFYHRYDVFGCFIEKGINILKKYGLLCFIQPSVFLNSKSFMKIREYIVKNMTIIGLNLLKDGIFENAVVPTMIMCMQNNQNENNKIKCSQGKLGNFYTLNQSVFLTTEANVFNLDLNDNVIALIQKTANNTILLGDIAKVSNAINVGNHSKFVVQGKNFANNSDYIKLLKGGSIQKWYHEFNDFYLKKSFDEFVSCGDIEVLKKPKLMMKRIGIVPNVCYDESGIAGVHTIHTIRLLNDNFSPLYVMALLNSKLIGYIFRLRVPLKGNVFPEFRVFDLNKQIPIKNITPKKQQPIINLVNQILAAKTKKHNADTTKLESEIDRLVYKLYELTEDEIKIIEG